MTATRTETVEGSAGGTRTETDSLGTIEIPADRYWGPQTERARALFRIGDAVAARNTHAAIYDALRLAKDL